MTAIALDAIGQQPVRIPPVAEPWQAEILRYAATLPALRPDPPMTSQGRYDLPDPHTGEKVPRGYGRVSNLAGSLDDPYGIHQWEQGLLIEGMLADGDLPAAYRTILDGIAAGLDADAIVGTHRVTANCDTPRQALAALRAHAMWAAGRDLKADVGTAFHTIAEHSDANQPITGAPLVALEALHAYDQALADHGIEILPNLIETCVVNPAIGVAGRADRFVRVPGVEHPVVADLKTGSLREIQHAIQLACYAHATHRWTPDGYEPMPTVDHDLGLIIAVDLEAGTCEIIPLNIAEGWRRAQVAAEARKANTEPKAVRATMPERPTTDTCDEQSPTDNGGGKAAADPSSSHTGVAESATGGGSVGPPPDLVVAHLADRIRTIAADDRLAATLFARFNAQGLTGPAEAHTWTDDHIAAIEAIANELEGIAPAPGEPPIGFVAPVEDPVKAEVLSGTDPAPLHPRAWDVADDDTPADDDLLARTIAAFGALPDEQRWWGHEWSEDARRANKAWNLDLRNTTARIAAINHAAVACLTHLWEDDDTLDPRGRAALRDRATRHALGIVLDDDLQTTWATGTVLGALDVDQALNLAEIAEAFGRGDDDTAALFAPLWGEPTPDLPPEAA